MADGLGDFLITFLNRYDKEKPQLEQLAANVMRSVETLTAQSQRLNETLERNTMALQDNVARLEKLEARVDEVAGDVTESVNLIKEQKTIIEEMRAGSDPAVMARLDAVTERLETKINAAADIVAEPVVDDGTGEPGTGNTAPTA